MKQLQENSVQEAKKELARKKRELERTERRIAEIDKLFMRIYEDNVSGKLSDEQFSKMSLNYEEEQQEKKILAEQLRAELGKEKEQNDGIYKSLHPKSSANLFQELTYMLCTARTNRGIRELTSTTRALDTYLSPNPRKWKKCSKSIYVIEKINKSKNGITPKCYTVSD